MPTILVAGIYAAYRMDAPPPESWKVASQPISEREHNAPAAMMAAVPVAEETKPVVSEKAAEPQTPIPAMEPVAPKRASARQRPAPAAHAPVRATPPVKHRIAGAAAGARVAETAPHPWQVMHVSLARCDGDLIARIVCELRARRQFCEGQRGEASRCVSGITNDHGQ